MIRPLLLALALFIAAPALAAVIAFNRGHHNRMPILLVNILLGWTFLGWVAALVWSFTSPLSGH